MIWGDDVYKVPMIRLSWSWVSFSKSCWQSPKSPILSTLLWTKIFAGLMSRWMILYLDGGEITWVWGKVLIEVLNSMEQLFEVKEDFFFWLQSALLPLFFEKTFQVLIIAVLQNNEHSTLVLSNHILHLYNVRVLPQTHQWHDLLPCRSHHVLNLFYLCHPRWNLYHLQSKFVNSTCHYLIKKAAVNSSIGSRAQPPLWLLSVVISKSLGHPLPSVSHRPQHSVILRLLHFF